MQTNTTKTPIQQQREVREAVASVMQEYAQRPNENWTDAVDEALGKLGYKTETPDNDDPWVIAQLATPIAGFGRVVVYREGRGEGPDAYDLAD